MSSNIFDLEETVKRLEADLKCAWTNNHILEKDRQRLQKLLEEQQVAKSEHAATFTIWAAGNKVGRALFATQELADKYASQFSAATGVTVMPLEVIGSKPAEPSEKAPTGFVLLPIIPPHGFLRDVACDLYGNVIGSFAYTKAEVAYNSIVKRISAAQPSNEKQIPEGWQLVPKMLNTAMYEAIIATADNRQYISWPANLWETVLEVAPKESSSK